MGVMNFLRERLGKIVAITIGVSLFAFIATEVITSGKSFLRGSANQAGEKITTDEFNKKVDQNTANYKQQTGQSTVNPQFLSLIQDNAWNQLVGQTILVKEMDKLGIAVGDNETQDMVSGPNPAPQVIQNFSNRQTGQFDRNGLVDFLNKVRTAKADDQIKTTWAGFVNELIESKKAEKYFALIKNGLFVNSLDARDDYESKNRLVNFKYVSADYASIPDDKVTLTDDDYKSYYDEHKAMFKNQQELRSFDYVAFNASPSKGDSADVKASVEKLIPDFKASTNDSLFVALNAETKAPLTYVKKGQLEHKLDTVMFAAAPGYIYGPYFSGDSYKLAKLVDSKMSYDSVKTRHILLNPTAEGGLEKARAKADSLKKLIQGGKSFADLAKTYSVDPGSKDKGGVVPAFDINGNMAGGAFVKEYVDASFNAKKGDLKIVTSQYGVHLIEILDQKGSAKVVKLAIIDKPLAASSKTQTAVYSKAQSFLASLTKDNFDEEVKKEGLTKKTAEDITGTASGAPGLDNTRDLIRWAFNDAEKGDFTDKIYTSGNYYVIAKLTQIKAKGVLTLDDVKKQIKPQVLNIAKAKLLTAKLNDAVKSASGIDQVAQKMGGKVTPVENVVFANPVLPGASQENKLIGAIFGSQPNKISKPVEGEKGVYVYAIDSFVNPAALSNTSRQKDQIGQALSQRAENGILEALKEKANIKDYRAKIL
jgi:peptidyl-prolyl cis-trans isomerase D